MSEVHPQVRADLQELESRIVTLSAAVVQLASSVETLARSAGDTTELAEAQSAGSKARGIPG